MVCGKHTLGYMNIVFRADASLDGGTGHVLRCLPIAEEAISRGIPCDFVGDVIDVDWVSKKIKSTGFSRILPSEEMHRAISHEAILVIDSYNLDISHPFLNRSHWKKIIAITDSVTPNYDADLAIHLGLDGSWWKISPSNFIYGPQYIPIRKSVQTQQKKEVSIIKRIVVSGGGSDPFNLALEIALAIAGKYEFIECIFFSADKINIENLDKRFKVLPFGPALDDVLCSADVALTTASTSCFEILARGIPFGVACAVSNQETYYSYLQKNALACPIGERNGVGVWNLNLETLETLLTNSKYRDTLVKKSLGLVDSNGSKRIVDAIEALS